MNKITYIQLYCIYYCTKGETKGISFNEYV